jgi:hypothetical protein
VARYDKIHLFRFDNGSERYDEGSVIEPGSAPVQFSLRSRAGCGTNGVRTTSSGAGGRASRALNTSLETPASITGAGGAGGSPPPHPTSVSAASQAAA